MFYFDNDRTKKLEELFKSKDIIGLENFIEKNGCYKRVYTPFKGRFYFNAKDNFSFKISPDQKTAVLACKLYNNHAESPAAEYNLEILVAQADAYGTFNKSEHIRFDNASKLNFVGLENNAVLLQNQINPQQILRYSLHGKALERKQDSTGYLATGSYANKKDTLLKARNDYRKALQKYPPNALQAKLAAWNEINSKIKL